MREASKRSSKLCVYCGGADHPAECGQPVEFIPCPVCKRDVRDHAADCSWANEPVGHPTC